MRFAFYLLHDPGGIPSSLKTDGRSLPPSLQSERLVFSLEGYDNESRVFGRQDLHNIMQKLELSKISRRQFALRVKISSEDEPAYVELEQLAQNQSRINGEKIAAGDAPKRLADNDIIGILSSPNQRDIIVGLLFRDLQNDLSQVQLRLASGAMSTLPTTPAPSNLDENNLRGAAGRMTGTELGKRSRFQLWEGMIQLSPIRDGAMYACYAQPVNLEVLLPPPWETWPSTITLQSRHCMDNATERSLMEKFVETNKCLSFAFMPSLHERNTRVEQLIEELSQKREFFSGMFGPDRSESGRGIRREWDFLFTVGWLPPKLKYCTPPMHQRAIVGIFDSRKMKSGAKKSRAGVGASWMACNFFVSDQDRLELRPLVMAATESGAVDYPRERIRRCRYPQEQCDVNFAFVPDSRLKAKAFSSTLYLRLTPSVKFLSLQQRGLKSGHLRRGPLELLRTKMCKEIFRRGGIVFVDGAYLLENLHQTILEKLRSLLIRFHARMQRHNFVIVFRESEIKHIVELGKFSQLAVRSVWEPLQRCIPADSIKNTLEGCFKFHQDPLSQDSTSPQMLPTIHSVEDSWPSEETLSDLFNSADFEPDMRNFRYIIMLSDVRDGVSVESEGESDCSISQDTGLGLQRMGLDAFEIWLESLRHAAK